MDRRVRVVTAILVLVAVAVAADAASVQPTVVGWERFFKLEWPPDTRHGRPVVSGYIQNDAGLPATRMRLLVEGLGPKGHLMGQHVAWLGTQPLMPGSRAYFEMSPAQQAAAYRVSVLAFDWVDLMGP